MSTIFKKWKVQITINLLLKGFSSFLNLSMHLVLSKCYFKANSDLLVFYKGFTVYIETFLIHFPKPQKKGNYRFKERELYSFWPSHACRNFCPW